MFKIGQKVRVTTAKQHNGGTGTPTSHNFKSGQVVTILALPASSDDTYRTLGDIGGTPQTQWLLATELSASVDLTKPVYTIEGTPVQIISTDGRDTKFPVLAYEGKAKNPSKYDLNGNSKSGETRRDLTNEVPKEEPAEATEIFVNLYDTEYPCDSPNGPVLFGGALGNNRFTSEALATADYKASRARDRRQSVRVGVAKLVLVKGRMPSAN